MTDSPLSSSTHAAVPSRTVSEPISTRAGAIDPSSRIAAVSRREFLKTALKSGAGAAALGATAVGGGLVAFPQPLFAREMELRRRCVVVGTGRHTYEVVHGWGKLPDRVHYGNTHGVVIDSHGRIYIHNQSKDSICVFDPDGTFIKSWGEEYAAGAHGLQLRKEHGVEYLYLAATSQHTVSKTTLDGELVWRIGYPAECPAYTHEGQYVPTNIAFAPNGDFYVADGYGLSWIHQYNIHGKYIRSWGGPGDTLGKLNCPHGIWLDTRDHRKGPRILVADRSNARLQYFSLDGQPLGIVKHDLRAPCHFDQRHGEILIPDLQGRVTIFDSNNNLVCHLGENPDRSKWANNGVPPDQWVDGRFCAPHAAVWDHQGNIIVVEWLRYGRVSRLRRVDA